MGRTHIVALLVIAAGVGGGLSILPSALNASTPDNRPVPIEDGIVFGAYDPHGDFETDSNTQIEHLFLPWEDVDLSSLAAADSYALERGRTLLITVEPWTWSQDKHIAPADLRAGIAAGRYNGNIAAICSVVRDFQTPTTLRWAQEMEDTTGRFIWSNWKPEDYVAAYRTFVEECREIAPNVAFMWSPKGEPSLGAYYPGDDVVDVIGLSVFGLQAYDHLRMGHDLTFADLLLPGYTEAVKFGKPIYVAELGYSGDMKYVSDWSETLLESLPQFEELKGVVYFNDRDVIAWPHSLGVPNWRVTSNIVEE